MKNTITFLIALIFLATARGASDADFTIVHASKVTITEDTVTIVCEAYATITLVYDDHIPEYKGHRWMGMPAERVKVRTGNNATLIMKHPKHGPEAAWKETLKLAKDLQDGKEVGRIGFYEPEMTIKGNVITSATGEGFLYPKGK